MPELWFHIQWGTFGSWLPGDPRGFRNHQHRIHSRGDYKNPPPPGEHRGLHNYAQRVLHKPRITLDNDAKAAVRDAIIAKSSRDGAHLRCVAVSSNHVHALLNIDPDHITPVVGALKRASSHAIRDRFPGRVWGARKHVDAVRDQGYLSNVESYILAHSRIERAATWHERMGCSE
ncbi:MAG: transposase [Phycisphaeraceae bacterium]|nr:transposase [Phycisphaeraceae bacterium]MCB9847121.1 transposase [Phycisphaeraceae bacterium]